MDLVMSVVKRRDLPAVNALINDLAPGSFVSVEEPSAIQRGWLFPERRKRESILWISASPHSAS